MRVSRPNADGNCAARGGSPGNHFVPNILLLQLSKSLHVQLLHEIGVLAQLRHWIALELFLLDEVVLQPRRRAEDRLVIYRTPAPHPRAPLSLRPLYTV